MEKIKCLIYPFLLVTVLYLSSCTRDDDYKKFAAGGERSYPGKPTAVIAQTGNKRVLLKVALGPDPLVARIKLYWNNRADSLEVPVVRSNGDTVRVFVDQHLNEGTNNFEVYTFNSRNDKSIVTNVSGNMFGDNYLSTVPKTNRPITSVALSAFPFITINWGTALISEQYIEIKYTDVSGTAQTLTVPSPSVSTKLPNYKAGTAITYRSIYAPDATSFDVISATASPVDMSAASYTAATSGYLYQPTGSKVLTAVKTWVPSGTNGIVIGFADLASTGYKALIVVNPDNTLTITAAPGPPLATGAPYTMFTAGLPTPYTPNAAFPGSTSCNNTYDPVTKTYKVRYGTGTAGSYRVVEEIITLN
ncbi:hypothetical protein DBR40_22000 [Pedobacter sp. KBW01]|uniref:DUF4998 domain-containing protein n=1 Tax=Pedobacter sp. KBW01 TaxID=2153364 RepID=UPI000F5AA733|nr:DUF4998 domain-containing protein [Pedobacter sp. KBW01]RQO66556.1 hypothetical protein DBR40_22000 [Pedobacter sp. KBW01]